MKKTPFLLITTALVTLATAQSPRAEVYVGAGGGIQLPADSDVDTTIGQDVEFDTGWGALGAVGYKYGNGLRTELELGYRDAGVDSVSLSAADGGDVTAWSLMGNVLYDIATDSLVTPYVGLGVGASRLNYEDVRTIAGTTLDDSDIVPAVQGIVGVAFEVAENVDLFGQYQYQHAFGAEPKTNAGVDAESDYGNSLFTAGLRWNFDVPKKLAPLPAPIAAPLPVRQPEPEPEKEVIAAPAIEKFMVFFDFDRSDLTIEAADILKKVATNAKAGKIARIELTGHADRAGSEVYNDALSQRRANTVKKQLVRLGLSASEIDTLAKGESSPLVPTNDGVREAQNRRVEIVYGD